MMRISWPTRICRYPSSPAPVRVDRVLTTPGGLQSKSPQQAARARIHVPLVVAFLTLGESYPPVHARWKGVRHPQLRPPIMGLREMSRSRHTTCGLQTHPFARIADLGRPEALFACALHRRHTHALAEIVPGPRIPGDTRVDPRIVRAQVVHGHRWHGLRFRVLELTSHRSRHERHRHPDGAEKPRRPQPSRSKSGRPRPHNRDMDSNSWDRLARIRTSFRPGLENSCDDAASSKTADMPQSSTRTSSRKHIPFDSPHARTGFLGWRLLRVRWSRPSRSR